MEKLTSVADSSIIYFYADFVSLGWSNLDILDDKVLSGLPGDSGLEQVS